MAVDLAGIRRAIAAGHKVSTRKAEMVVRSFHQPKPPPDHLPNWRRMKLYTPPTALIRRSSRGL